MFVEARCCWLTTFASITLYCMITGRHVKRTALPGPAGGPGCSSSLILVPVYEQPVICVISWSGEIIHSLGAAELGLHSKDRGGEVSPVLKGMFHFFVMPAGRGFEIHTYKVRITYLSLTDCSYISTIYVDSS